MKESGEYLLRRSCFCSSACCSRSRSPCNRTLAVLRLEAPAHQAPQCAAHAFLFEKRIRQLLEQIVGGGKTGSPGSRPKACIDGSSCAVHYIAGASGTAIPKIGSDKDQWNEEVDSVIEGRSIAISRRKHERNCRYDEVRRPREVRPGRSQGFQDERAVHRASHRSQRRHCGKDCPGCQDLSHQGHHGGG